MQSTHAAVNMSATTAAPSRQPPPAPPAASLAPGQLGPSPAIPTLKQLQDHHIKAKQIGGAVATNNNSATASNNNYKGAMQPPRTVPPVVLKLDAQEPSTKRTYSVSTAHAESSAPAEASGDNLPEPVAKKARKSVDSAEAPSFVLKVPAGLDASLGPSPVVHTPGVILAVERPPLPGLLPYPPPNPFLVGLPPPPTSPLALLPPTHLPPPATPPMMLLPPPRPPSGSTASMPAVGAPTRPPSRPSSTGSTASSSSRGSTAARTNPTQSSPRGKRKSSSRQQGPEENREGLLDCVKHVPENFQVRQLNQKCVLFRKRKTMKTDRALLFFSLFCASTS